MGFADELVLEVAAQRQPQASEEMAGAGDGLQHVVHIAANGVEFEEETLGALLDVHGGGGVEEAESSCCVDGFNDAAHVHGPKSQCVSFHGDDLADLDMRGGFGYARPSVIEHGPLAEGLLGCIERWFAVAYTGAGMVVNEAEGEERGGIEAVCERQARGRV